MRKYVVLATSGDMASALTAVIPIYDRCAPKAPDADAQVECICVDARVGNSTTLFDRIAARLGRVVSWCPAEDLVTTVIVDGVDALSPEFMPLKGGWHGAVAMLVLAFPEVEWIFVGPNEFGLAPEPSERALDQLSKPHVEPLFDGEGVRASIMRRTQLHRVRRALDEQEAQPAAHLTARTDWGVAIDDEVEYAYLHAYAMYRYGLRAIPVTRWGTSLHVLGPEAVAIDGEFVVSIEDHFIQFPDCDKPVTLSNHDMRLVVWPRLQPSPAGNGGGLRSICVTTGHRHAEDKDNLETRNRRFGDRICKKPLHGILAVRDILGGTLEVDRGDYQFPGRRQDGGLAGDTGHSAPGRLLQIANHLMSRARLIRANGGDGMAEQVRGAVMACLAVELLGGRTPTLSVAALDLMNELEIEAECGFGGFSYDISIDERMKVYRKDVRFVACWHDPKTSVLQHVVACAKQIASGVRRGLRPRTDRIHCEPGHTRWSRLSALNAELMGLLKMRKVLAAYAQIDEERKVRIKQLHVDNELWRAEHPALGWAFFLPMTYVEQFLAHWKIIGSLNLVFLCFLGAVHTNAEALCGKGLLSNLAVHESAGEWARGAVSVVRWIGTVAVMTGVGDSSSIPPDVTPCAAQLLRGIVMIIAAASGVVNFGLLVTIFYERISRR